MSRFDLTKVPFRKQRNLKQFFIRNISKIINGIEFFHNKT